MTGIQFVYCVGSQAGNPVKVGLTADPMKRLSGIQAHNWQQMRLFWVVWGRRKDERRLIDTGERIRGEWLRDPYGIIAGKFESDLLLGPFVGPLSPLLGSLKGAMAWQHRWELMNGRDLHAIARATCLPRSLKPHLAKYCADRSLTVHDVPDAPARDFSLATAPDRESAA